MSFKNGVLEGSRLDFGSPGPRFWRVLGSFFRDFGPLGRRSAGTDFELEAKAVQLQLGAQVASSSFPLPPRSSATIFYLKVGPRSSAGVGGRRCPPLGAFNPPPTEGVHGVLDPIPYLGFCLQSSFQQVLSKRSYGILSSPLLNSLPRRGGTTGIQPQNFST